MTRDLFVPRVPHPVVPPPVLIVSDNVRDNVEAIFNEGRPISLSDAAFIFCEAQLDWLSRLYSRADMLTGRVGLSRLPPDYLDRALKRLGVLRSHSLHRISNKLRELMKRADVVVFGLDRWGKDSEVPRRLVGDLRVDYYNNTLTTPDGRVKWTSVSMWLAAQESVTIAAAFPKLTDIANRGHVPTTAGASVTDRQLQFDAKLRSRIATKERGPHREPMIQWAQLEFDILPDDAQALWLSRSKEFPRIGRHRKPRAA